MEISFSPQPSATVTIKDGGHNFRQQNTEHLLAKITPALQTNNNLAFFKIIYGILGLCTDSARSIMSVGGRVFYLLVPRVCNLLPSLYNSVESNQTMTHR